LGLLSARWFTVLRFALRFWEELIFASRFWRVDQRAIYGKSKFPEPLLAPEMDVESELRLDWFHSEKSGFAPIK